MPTPQSSTLASEHILVQDFAFGEGVGVGRWGVADTRAMRVTSRMKDFIAKEQTGDLDC